jgi:hypothetical protein
MFKIRATSGTRYSSRPSIATSILEDACPYLDSLSPSMRAGDRSQSMKLRIESLAEKRLHGMAYVAAVPSEQQEATWSSLSAVAVLA